MRFVTVLTVARVVRHAVAALNTPPEAMINRGDFVTSARSVTVMLPDQMRPAIRIVFMDTAVFLGKLTSNAQGTR